MIKNAMTIDVEDYFQVSALAEKIHPEDWDRIPCRVERNTEKLLEIFSEHNVKATFFILGWIGERYPNLVNQIHSEGHEVASHGYSHQLVYNQSQKLFREETKKSKNILEDITCEAVEGYRAASYSITPSSRWALDILCELGFTYDSSLFPVKHDRYGMPDANPHPHILTTPKGQEITEFSLTSLNLLGYRVPIAGGGYFRLFPYWLTEVFWRRFLKQEGVPATFYLHPWEIDPDQPKVNGLSLPSRFRHYNNLQVTEGRLHNMLNDFEFTTMKKVLEAQGLLVTKS